jgi:hypothetical protein
MEGTILKINSAKLFLVLTHLTALCTHGEIEPQGPSISQAVDHQWFCGSHHDSGYPLLDQNQRSSEHNHRSPGHCEQPGHGGCTVKHKHTVIQPYVAILLGMIQSYLHVMLPSTCKSNFRTNWNEVVLF